MATARPPFSIPGVILFSQGDLSYEVDLSHGLVEDLAQSKLGERTVLAWERMGAKRLRSVIVRSVPPTSSRDQEELNRMRARLRGDSGVCVVFDRRKLEAHLANRNHFIARPVDYVQLDAIGTVDASDIHSLPFSQ